MQVMVLVSWWPLEDSWPRISLRGTFHRSMKKPASNGEKVARSTSRCSRKSMKEPRIEAISKPMASAVHTKVGDQFRERRLFSCPRSSELLGSTKNAEQTGVCSMEGKPLRVWAWVRLPRYKYQCSHLLATPSGQSPSLCVSVSSSVRTEQQELIGE